MACVTWKPLQVVSEEYQRCGAVRRALGPKSQHSPSAAAARLSIRRDAFTRRLLLCRLLCSARTPPLTAINESADLLAAINQGVESLTGELVALCID